MFDSPASSRERRPPQVALDHLVLALAPIRAGTAWALALAGLLVLAGTLTVPGSDGSAAEILAGFADHPGQSQVSDLLLHCGWILLALASVGLVLLASSRRGPLLVAGGVLALLGLTTLPGLFATDAWDLTLAQQLPRGSAVEISEEAAGTSLAAILFVRGSLGAVFGPALLLTALWRQGLVGGAVPLLAFAGPLAAMAGGGGTAGKLGAGAMAVGYGLAAWRLLRGARAEEPADRSGAAAAPADAAGVG